LDDRGGEPPVWEIFVLDALTQIHGIISAGIAAGVSARSPVAESRASGFFVVQTAPESEPFALAARTRRTSSI
jgi:hypothetical protein